LFAGTVVFLQCMMMVVIMVVVASPEIIDFLEALVLGQLELCKVLHTPVAVLARGVTPRLVHHPEAPVLALSLSLDCMFWS
jgi:hypothetical protein